MSNARYIGEVAPTLGRKNLLINGGMDVWQRGLSGSFPLGSYTYMADRWKGDPQGAACTWSAGSNPTNDAVTSGSLVIQGAASNTAVYLRQHIESRNSYRTYGKKLTLSVKVYLIGASRNISAYLYRPTTTANDFSSTTVIGSTQILGMHGGTGWETMTVTFPTTMPKEVQKGLGLSIFTTNLNSTAQYFGITDVQLEVGEEVTEFERRPFGEEFAACQRYFQKSSPYGTAVNGNSAVAGMRTSLANMTGTCHTCVEFAVTMRIAPTVTVYSTADGTSGTMYFAAIPGNRTAVVDSVGDTSFRVYNSVAAVDGAGGTVHFSADAEL